MVKTTNNGRSHNDTEKPSDRRNHITRGNTKEWYQGTGSTKGTWEERWSILRENIYIPNNRRIWEQILQENYNLADIRYSEQQQMLELIKRNCW